MLNHPKYLISNTYIQNGICPNTAADLVPLGVMKYDHVKGVGVEQSSILLTILGKYHVKDLSPVM